MHRLLFLAAPLVPPGPSVGDDPAPELTWNARAAEHLLNRAGFGARELEIQRAVLAGPEAVVAELLAGGTRADDPYFAERLARSDGGMQERIDRLPERFRDLDRDARRDMARDLRRDDAAQLIDYTAAWIEDMVAGRSPLVDRTALFWHGYFTSSQQDVKSSYNLIQQHEFLRANALGSFRDLVHGIARQPAMLEYLDNNSNKKKSPNENFARELLELFTLGEGHYTEEDVKEVARAFTGWTEDDGEFEYKSRWHDTGKKTVLGERGKFDGDDVIDVILAHEACPPHVARALLSYFEGVEPGPERLGEYAAHLRATDYDVAAFLEKLFLDPHFYSDAVVGARISGPIDFVVGTNRRLAVPMPAAILGASARLLGQRLFHPPNVKGWDGGESWITTSTLMQRGNVAGLMLGVVEFDDVLRVETELMLAADDAAMMADDELMASGDGDEMSSFEPAKPKLDGAMRDLDGLLSRWRPRLNLSARVDRLGLETDAEIGDALIADLLAVEPAADTRAALLEFLTREREALGLAEGELRAGSSNAEDLLRRFAHQILCQPEAQLH